MTSLPSDSQSPNNPPSAEDVSYSNPSISATLRGRDRRQRHIPTRYSALAEQLSKRFCRKTTDGLFNFDEADRARLLELSELISEVTAKECNVLRDQVFDHYENLNPDNEQSGAAFVGKEAEAAMTRTLRELAYIFDRAGYMPLPKETFDYALKTINVSGVEVGVDFSVFDFVAMYERGRGKKTVKTPGFLGLYEKPITVEVITRLGVILKLREQSGIYIKMFKDIPTADLEAVLPGASIRMSSNDKIWLLSALIPALIAIVGVAYEKFTSADKFSETTEKVMMGLALLAGGRAYQVYYTYSVLKDQAAGRLARQLYYQQLDGNAGVLSQLIDKMCQQESKLALIAYVMSLRAEKPLANETMLDLNIEAFLSDRFGLDINFDMPLAIELLRRWGLWLSEDGQPIRVVELDKALELLSHQVSLRSKQGRFATLAASQCDEQPAMLHVFGDPQRSLA